MNDDTKDASLWRLYLSRKCISTPCHRCSGIGAIYYANTAKWRGGGGGNSFTTDVCDHCWGSGDEHEHWTDLRRLEHEEDGRVRERAADLFRQRCGVWLRTLHPAIEELCTELEKFSRQRRPRPYGFDTVTRCLAKLLRELVAAERKSNEKPPA